MLINFSMSLLYQVAIQMVTFLVFFVLVKKLFYKPINDMINKRDEKIKSELHEANDANEKAKSLVVEYQEKIDNVANEKFDIIKQASKDGEVIKEKIIADARVDADKVIQSAKHEIEAQKLRAEEQLKDAIVELTIEATQKVVSKSLNKEDHLKLINESIDLIKGV